MREINRINNIKKFNELFDKTNEEINWIGNDNYDEKSEIEEISPIVNKTYTEEDMENAFESGKDSIEFDEERGYGSTQSFGEWIKEYNSNK